MSHGNLNLLFVHTAVLRRGSPFFSMSNNFYLNTYFVSRTVTPLRGNKEIMQSDEFFPKQRRTKTVYWGAGDQFDSVAGTVSSMGGK